MRTDVALLQANLYQKQVCGYVREYCLSQSEVPPQVGRIFTLFRGVGVRHYVMTLHNNNPTGSMSQLVICISCANINFSFFNAFLKSMYPKHQD